MNANNAIVELINEPAYSFGSTDNVRSYETEVLLDNEFVSSSIHGILIDDHPVVVVGASGGATGIHDHSLLRREELIYFAVGPFVCRMTLGQKTLDWSVQIDSATCFGIHYSEQHEALISHGELSIARFSREGEILWSAGGADIFSEEFSLLPDFVEVIDFNHSVYHFGYDTGGAKRDTRAHREQ